MTAYTVTARNGLFDTAPRQDPAPAARPGTNSAGISLAAAIAVIAAVATNLRPGIVSIGPVLGLLRSEFHISNAQASLLTAIPTLLMGLLAIPTPWMARRFGRNRVILVALAVLGLATLLRAFSTSAVVLLFATAGVGAGIAVAGALISGFVKAHHPGRVSLLMGLYAASLGLGSTVAAALTGPVASLTGGWRVATAMWVLPGLAAIAAWIYVSKAEGALALPARAATQVAHPHPARSWTAWLAAMYFAANNFLFFGLLAWFVPMNMEFGASPATAGLMLAGFTTVFMFSNPVPALVSKGADRRLAIGLFAGAFMLGISLVIASPHQIGWLAIGLLAFGIGGSFSLGMTLPLDNTVDADQANSWTSFTLAIGYGLGALGPLSIGLVRDMTHSFVPALWLLAAAGALKLVLTPFLSPRLPHRTA
ncbi:MFS transporter [Roseateles amylovorans]|uniref:MFS transporter n=1 Tax=Roseateles amylovorans TaxID=2978473 RepID=A0ABY6B791_9BURK|nr:MFS transporter [Roseateles amylovorans]UXH79086.1 MFS transporter [Roseateles amylovorans]